MMRADGVKLLRLLSLMRMLTMGLLLLGRVRVPEVGSTLVLVLFVIVFLVHVLIILYLAHVGSFLVGLLKVLDQTQHSLLKESRVLGGRHIDRGLRYLRVDDHREFLLHLLHTALALLLVQQGVHTDKRVHLVRLLVDIQVSLRLEVDDVSVTGEQSVGGLPIRAVAVVHCERIGKVMIGRWLGAGIRITYSAAELRSPSARRRCA